MAFCFISIQSNRVLVRIRTGAHAAVCTVPVPTTEC
jgi:hypothetical protein